MKTKTQHIKHALPHKISEYIKLHYEGGTLVDIKEEEKRTGHMYYLVDVSDADNIYHLEFSKDGNLVKQEVEPIFPEDRHEDFFREEGFYEENY